MKTVHFIADVRARVRSWRSEGLRVGFVPTMGNLHAGHLELVQRARESADRVVVSIFVNPLQFGPSEDFAAYPRTLEDDQAKLEAEEADLLFSPSEAEMYPRGRAGLTTIEVPGLSDILCGASRPGHFRGVATVVAKLFQIVQPDVAVFGQKDYQQFLVIQAMVDDLCVPVSLIPVPTVREDDGLALSSRNGYLNEAERRRAPQLYRALATVAGRLREGEADFPGLERDGADRLRKAGFEVDYFTIRDADSLQVPSVSSRLAVLGAARLGSTRLIDNIVI